ncbi:MAG: hypothetical protein RJQ09_15815 [Cyclobacteriaceae bacterium]
MTNFRFLPLPAFIVILFSCSSDPEPGTIIFANNNLEIGEVVPQGWNAVGDPDIFLFYYGAREPLSGEKSISISAESANSEAFAFWVNSTPFDGDKNAGKRLTLTAWVKGVNLSGNGAAVALRGDVNVAGSEGSEQFVTTQGIEDLSGSFEWQKISVNLDIQANIDSYTVFLLLLSNTTGEVFFDDITLEKSN